MEGSKPFSSRRSLKKFLSRKSSAYAEPKDNKIIMDAIMISRFFIFNSLKY
jgi:hypothetical protein